MQLSELAGRRILVVEDEFILAADICWQIEEHRGVVIGPAAGLAQARALFQAEPQVDGGILDIRLGKEMVYPLADSLLAAGVPIVFASSELRSAIPSKYKDIPLMSKPLDLMDVAERLFKALEFHSE